MSKKANPVLIGGFVVGAIALLAISAMLFGGSQALKTKFRFVSYFDGSVKGLRIGSNVMFRGVPVGYVTDVKLYASLDTLETLIPVIYEIDPDKFKFTKNSEVVGKDSDEVSNFSVDDWISVGLRAELDSESFVTGQLMIELDFKPGTEAVFRNKTIPYPEIPSIRSGITQAIEDAQRFFSELQQEVDVKDLNAKLTSILAGVDQLANSQELRSAIAGIDTVVNAEGTQTLPDDLSNAIKELSIAIASAENLINGLDSNLVPATQNLAATLEQAEAFLSSANAQLDGESLIAVEISKTLTEVSDAARSIRVLADYLEQHPEALIRGKK
jgi:paraquat-inducible protein B